MSKVKTDREQAKPKDIIVEGDASDSSGTQDARRTLLGVGLPAAMAMLATACGSNMFGNSKSKSSTPVKAPVKTNPADLGGNGRDKPGTTPAKPEPSVMNPPDPIPVEQISPCSPLAPGLITLPAVGMPPAIDVGFKLYGRQIDSMVVMKAADFQAGDVVMLVRILGPLSGKLLARRVVTTSDAATKVIIFDGVYLGSETTKLGAVVVRAGEQKRSADVALKFEVDIQRPGSADPARFPIVDTLSVSDDPRYSMKGAHPNYHEPQHALTVCMAFGTDTGFTEGEGQWAKAGSSAGRKLKKAGATAVWKAPSNVQLPGRNAPSAVYYVCDAFGDPINSGPVVAGRFPAADQSSVGSLLKVYSTIIVYVMDGAHFHRYFFNIG